MNKLKHFFTFNFHDLNFRQLKTYDFWFNIDPVKIHAADRTFAIIGAVLVFFGIVAYVYSSYAHNEFMAKVARWKGKILVTIGIAEMVWFMLRYENVQLFGTHFVAGLILLIGLIWLYFPAKYYFTRYNTDLVEAERKANREKYLNRK